MPRGSDSKQVVFLCSDDEHRQLHELAASEGRTASSWLRAMINRMRLMPQPLRDVILAVKIGQDSRERRGSK